MICYCIRNKINGKRYIGITIQRLGKRLRDHISKVNTNGKCIFHNSIRKQV
jgi:predicted GIY-YIG superfamily endonuclease